MRKRVFLAILLVVALILTTSCSLIVKDQEVDKSTVIIEAAGKTFTKEEVQEQVNLTLDYQEYIYSMYGMSYDKTDASAIAEVQESVIKSMIELAVIDQKKVENGMTELSAEDVAAVQTEADETYQGYVDSVKTQYFAETELEGEELDKAVDEKVVELGYSTVDEILSVLSENKATENLRADIVKDVAVSDDEIQAEFDVRVANAKATYETTPGAYGTAVTNGTAVYYAPAGYRYVKHILRQLTTEDSDAISEIQTQVTSKQTQLTTAQTALTDLGEAAESEDEAIATQRTEYAATIETLSTEIADLNTQLDAAKETGYAAIQPMIDEIQAKIDEGQDFDALMEEYGEDPGMQSSPAKENGYLVCEASSNWVAEFTSASMALSNVGDVSPAVRTSYGVHIIKYESDLAEGEVELDTVKDVISEDLLANKQDALYEETVAQWVSDANAKSYLDRLAK